jgi:tetratricopeptide (TPR) repeat protein
MSLDFTNDQSRQRFNPFESPNLTPLNVPGDNDAWRAIVSSASTGNSNAPWLNAIEIVDGGSSNPADAPYMVASLVHVARPEPWESTNPSNLYNSAIDFKSNGNLEAAGRCFQQMVDIEEERMNSCDGDPLALAGSLENLARIHQRSGNLAEAGPLLERAVELNRAHRAPDDLQLAYSLTNLAEHIEAVRVSGVESGRPGPGNRASSAATDLLRQALPIFEAQNNPRLLHEARIRLATNLSGVGNEAEASQVLRQILDSSAEGSAQRAEASALMAPLTRRSGERNDSDRLIQTALDYRRAHGGSAGLDRALIFSLQQLAALESPKLFKGGDSQVRIQRLEQADTIARESFGAQSPEFARVRAELGQARTHNGDFAHGYQLLEHALSIQERRLGEGHPESMATRESMIWNRSHDGDAGGAEALSLRQLELVQRTRGANHRDVGAAAMTASSMMRANGNLPGALTLARQAERVYQTRQGEHPEQYADALGVVAELQMANNLPAEALVVTTQAVQIARTRFANDPLLQGRYMMQHAEVLRANGMEAESQRFADQALRLLDTPRKPKPKFN